VARTKTLTLIVVVLILGIMGIILLKPGTKPDDTGDQSSADITQPEEPETPEEEPVLLAVESQYELGFDAY
jgi:hypothetical protein